MRCWTYGSSQTQSIGYTHVTVMPSSFRKDFGFTILEVTDSILPFNFLTAVAITVSLTSNIYIFCIPTIYNIII